MEAAIAKGPISIAIYANTTEFMNYAGGIFTAPPDCGTGNLIDHAIILVGYDTTASDPFWILRNSWGTSWG